MSGTPGPFVRAFDVRLCRMLPAVVLCPQAGVLRVPGGFLDDRRREPLAQDLHLQLGAGRGSLGTDIGQRQALPEDRKSTRLNSSPNAQPECRLLRSKKNKHT